MIVRVDEDVAPQQMTFAYENYDGQLDQVTLGHSVAVIHDNCPDGAFRVYVCDVPNMVKALKAAYKHKTGETI